MAVSGGADSVSLLLLLLAILSTLHLAQVRNFAIKPATASLGRALFAALTFQVNVLEADHGYLPGSWDILWSLSVEEMFYLFFPLLCRGLGRGKLLIAALIGIGFAWPIVILWVAGVGLVVLAVAAICEGGEVCTAADCFACDCPNCADCNRKNKRRQRVEDMIREREKWLQTGSGPPPARRNLRH